MITCLVLVKIKGNSPIKLLIIINIKIETKVKLKKLFFIIIILNSLFKVFNKFAYIRLILLGVNQNILGMINRRIIMDIQFNEKKFVMIVVDGSNIENRLVIIFK